MSIPLNPVDFMIRRIGLSRAEVTAKHRLGKNLLLKASQGRVQTITPRISVVLWKEWQDRGIDQDEFDALYRTLDLDLAYQTWRQKARKRNKGEVPTRISQNVALSPFRRLVDAIGGEARTAKLLFVPDVPVSQYASGRQKAMPVPILEALKDLEYPHIDTLDRAQRTWRENQGLD